MDSAQKLPWLSFSRLTLPSAENTILLFHFDLDREDVELFERVLNEEERATADRRRGQLLRTRYVVGRGATRRVIGALLNKEPASVKFGHGPHGKPYLPDELRFNLSHSEGSALLAATQVRGLDETSLGVDLEYVRDWQDLDDLAHSVYTLPELAWLEDLEDPQARREAFFRLWTVKESFMKATGEGMTRPLQEFRAAWSEG
ncbi:MAG: 4'-phosphopantetheinyl transferase superfamily protein, partial [Planctomycetota bacterium]